MSVLNGWLIFIEDSTDKAVRAAAACRQNCAKVGCL
jgi:hypothetical protein